MNRNGNEIDIEVQRESFAIQSTILIAELNAMIERTYRLEKELGTSTPIPTNSTDFFRADPDIQMPPKKKMKVAFDSL